MEKQEVKTKNKKITEMLEKIPVGEAERIERETKREENLELKTLKMNTWRKWRGKTKVLERKTTILREIEKVDARMIEIAKKIEQYKERRDEQLERGDKKKREWKEKHRMIIEDHWSMLWEGFKN